MPMTPDEVVKELEQILKFTAPLEPIEKQAIHSAISLLQDYQKLRERVSVEEIDSLIRNYAFRHECNLGNEGIILEKSICEIAQAIVTYLQQPTEPIER